MASNALELSIKIAGKIDNSFNASITAAQKQASSLTKALSTVGKAGLALEGAIFTGMVAGLKQCADYAQEVEVTMADVAKYVGGLTNSEGKVTDEVWDVAEGGNGKTYRENYNEMKSELFKLSTQYALTPDELMTMASDLGQSGYDAAQLASVDESGNVTGVLRDTATMAAAFDIDTGLAGEYMAKWENAFNLPHDKIMVLCDQINYLGNTSATTAAEISEAVNRSGSLGGLSGVDTGTTAALATVMLQAGGNSATVGTSLNRIFTNMMKGSSATDAQEGAWNKLGLTAEGVASSMIKNGQATLVDVFTRISNLAEDKRTSVISTLFGQWAIADVSRVISNMPELETALGKIAQTGTDENGNATGIYTGSMTAEANTKNSTTAATAQMAESAKQWMMDSIGEQFLPVMAQFNRMKITLYTTLAENAPELAQVAGTFANLLSDFVDKLSEELPKLLPYLQEFLDWLSKNPETALEGVGTITSIFLTMASLPKIEKFGKLLLGTGGNPDGTGLGRLVGKGGLLGRGGTVETVRGIWGDAKGIWQASKTEAALSGKGGFFSTLGTAATSVLPKNEVVSLYGVAGKLGSKASTALGGAAVGTGAVAGGILGAAGIGSGIYDIYKGTQTTGKEAKDKYFSGGTKIGMVGAGAATGAAIGSVVPIVGTAAGALIGAGVGGVSALVTGSDVGKKLSDATDEGGWLSNMKLAAGTFLTQTLPTKWGELWTGVGNFITQGIPAWLSSTNQKVTEFCTQTLPQKWGEFWTSVGDFLTQSVPYAIGYAVGKAQIFLFETLPEKWTEFWDAVGEFFANAKTWATNIWNNSFLPFIHSIPQRFKNMLDAVGEFWANAKTWATNIWNNSILPFLKSIPGKVKGVLDGVWDFLTNDLHNIVQAIWDSIYSFATQTIPNILGKVWDGVTDAVSNGWNNIKSSFSAGYNAATGKGNTAASKTVTTGAAKAGKISLPAYANGGFTNGPSIAGEAGTEAVISFKRSERTANLANWWKAGQMLNAGAELKQIGGSAGGTGSSGGRGETITFAPVFNFNGEVTKEKAEEAGRISFAEFKRLYQQMKREEARTSFAW